MRLSAPIFRLKRDAKLLARDQNIPLHQALDRLAVQQGFQTWSHLASRWSERSLAERLLAELKAGDLLLVGARPGHGKTLLGLEMAALASRLGRKGLFFTLDYNEGDVLDLLTTIGLDNTKNAHPVIIDTSDDICAHRIIERLGDTAGNVIAVVDYLQLLDQRRSTQSLGDQISALREYAKAKGAMLVVISQVDRSFELKRKALPDLEDVRLPNQLDLSLFDKTCFLHDGEIRLGSPG